MIYFDNAATSLIKPNTLKKKLVYAINSLTANPGRSGHKLSFKVAEEIFDARENLKKMFNANDYDVIFTKNCTEALNLAIFGLLNSGDHVITSMYEHNSVLRPLEVLKARNVEVEVLNCDLCVFEKELEHRIKDNTRLVILTGCSNVTGETSNIDKVVEVCKTHNIMCLIDGAQLCGHKVIDLEKTPVDMLAFAGHKGLMSITGVGGLLVKKGTNLRPLLYGGTGTNSAELIQPLDIPEGYESGTLPSIPIITLNESVKFLLNNKLDIYAKEKDLSNYLYKNLYKLEFIELYSNEKSLNVFAFNVDGIDAMEVANILNEKYNICVRSGLHCAPLIHKKLGTFNRGAVRVSIDFNNSYQEIDYLIKALEQIYYQSIKDESLHTRLNTIKSVPKIK